MDFYAGYGFFYMNTFRRLTTWVPGGTTWVYGLDGERRIYSGVCFSHSKIGPFLSKKSLENGPPIHVIYSQL